MNKGSNPDWDMKKEYLDDLEAHALPIWANQETAKGIRWRGSELKENRIEEFVKYLHPSCCESTATRWSRTCARDGL